MIDGFQIFTGLTIDLIYRQGLNVYNKDTNAFESWSDSQYSHYLNRAAEQGTSGYYVLTRPFTGTATISLIQHVDGTLANDKIKGSSADSASGSRTTSVEIIDMSIK